MQREGKGLGRSPTTQQERYSGGSAKAERETADQSVRGLKVQAASLSRFCSSEEQPSRYDEGSAFLLGSGQRGLGEVGLEPTPEGPGKAGDVEESMSQAN